MGKHQYVSNALNYVHILSLLFHCEGFIWQIILSKTVKICISKEVYYSVMYNGKNKKQSHCPIIGHWFEKWKHIYTIKYMQVLKMMCQMCVHSHTCTYTNTRRGILLLKSGYQTICVVKSHFILKSLPSFLYEVWKIIYQHVNSDYPWMMT